MTDWNPAQYLRYGNERLRPALDLLAKVQIDNPGVVYDLGCGTGTITALLKERWPAAHVTGVDSSESMLERTQELGGDVEWQHSDLNTWTPGEPPDLLYSNAALHWLDDHETLFPKLLGYLKPGGVLAVQIPNNFGEPSHTSISAAVREGHWEERLAPYQREHPVSEPAFYYDLLSANAAALDMWETTYMHILEGENPVVEWTKGTMVPPLLAQLDEAEGAAFMADYQRRVAAAYPHRPDGKTVFPFRRLFMIAVK